MKKIFISILAATFLMANLAHAAYIGSGSGNDQEKWVMENIEFAKDVETSDDFSFSFINKFDDVGEWNGTDPWTVGGVTIAPATYNEKKEITGVSFTIDPEEIKPGLEFISLKAGAGKKDKEGGFAFYSIDLSGGSFILTTEALGGKEISHISLWETGKGKITYPGSSGGAQVPEPATIFLLGSGLLGFFGFRKKFWKAKPNTKE